MTNPFPWIRLQHITQYWDGKNEFGTDIGLPVGTRITSVSNGRVIGRGYYWGGGVVTVRGFIDGGINDVYYQHLDLIADEMRVGVEVHTGELIGWSGGQCDGSGNHPQTRRTPGCGPHIEFGINPPWGGIWGSKSGRGKNYDPLPLLEKLASGQYVGPKTGDITSEPGRFETQSFGANFSFSIQALGPNDDVTTVLVDIDKYLDLFNPFIVTPDEHSVLQAGPINIDIIDPAKWLNGVLTNLLIMVVAIPIRMILILLGTLVIIFLLFTFINQQAVAETGFQAARLTTVLS